ncbi:MAG: hypothetical protein IPP66_04625 [Anaerolineales bacterium]|nr:hypothetical protein [Anaerolineales bacterium]
MVDNSSKGTLVTAVVAPGSFNNARYQFDFSLWKPSDNSRTILFSREFEQFENDSNLLSSIEELEKIILSLFLCDSVPRKIYYFEYTVDSSAADRLKFLRVFGQPRAHFESEQFIHTKSFFRLGHFTQSPLENVDFVPPESDIKSWFNFLSQNAHISASLALIQESFGLAHELYAGLRITSFTELSTVLLLLVSGLESLFTHGSDSHADISFKFRTVGAAFYTKYFQKSSLQRNDINQRGKFTYTEIKNILRLLYDLRSTIAHGNFNLTFFSEKRIGKLLDNLFSAVGVGEVSKDMKSIYFAHLLLSLELLEGHILGVFRGAKSSLNMGVDILDEVLSDKDNS